MKPYALVALASLTLSACSVSSPAGPTSGGPTPGASTGVDLSGRWTARLSGGQEATYRLTLAQSGTLISGTAALGALAPQMAYFPPSGGNVTGAVDNGQASLTASDANGAQLRLTGAAQVNTWTGTWTGRTSTGATSSGTFTATREQ